MVIIRAAILALAATGAASAQEIDVDAEKTFFSTLAGSVMGWITNAISSFQKAPDSWQHTVWVQAELGPPGKRCFETCRTIKNT